MNPLAAFLEALEDDDREAMRRLLLGPDGRAIADFLFDDDVMADAVAAEGGPVRPARPNRFGHFVLLDRGTAGGFAVVFQAWNVELKCVVALKMPRHAADLDVVGRFLEEAQAIARLGHPHVVPIRDFGVWQGVPYFTMPWFGRGHLRPMRSAPADAARLMVAVASAVAHAHGHGLLHMDLKPSNILLDDHGRPLVADFGLALRADAGSADGRRGTPDYMSPEQRSSEEQPATVAMDVYGLGAVLFFLLTDSPPQPAGPRALNARVPVDLDAICRKALHRDPAQRYDTAEAFAADLRAWLAWRPTAACPPGLARRVGLWCRRHPLIVLTLAAAVLITGLSGVIAYQSVQQARTQEAARRRAELFRDLAAEVMDPPMAGWRQRGLDRVRGWVALHPGPDAELRDRTVALLRGADARLIASRNERDGIEASCVAFDPAGARVLIGGMGERGPTRLWHHESDEMEELMRLGPGPVGFRGGRPIQLVAPGGGGPEVWDLAARRRLLTVTFAGPLAELANGTPALAMTAGGRRLAAAGAVAVAVWDGDTGARLLERACGPPRAIALSADGSRLALAEEGGSVRVVPVGGGPEAVLTSLPGVEAHAIAFDPSGERLAVGYTGGATVFRLDDRQAVAHCHGGSYDTTALAWSANGATLLVASNNRARLFDAHSGRPLLDLPCNYPTSAAIADDGRLIVGVRRTFGLSPTYVWRLEAGGLVTLPGLVGFTQLVALDGREAALAVLTHTWQVAVYDLATGGLLHVFRVPGRQPGDTADNCALAFSADGRRLALASGGRATEWDLSGRSVRTSWDLPAGGVVNALVTDGDGWLLFRAEGGGGRRQPTLWGLRPGRQATTVSRWPTVFRRVTRAAACPGGERFVFFACGEGQRRELIGITRAGAAAWQEQLDQANDNVGVEVDATGRVLFISPPEPPPYPFRLDAAGGERLGPAEPFPLAYSEAADLGLFIAGAQEGGAFRQAVVRGLKAEGEQFRLGPVLASNRGCAITRDGNRIIYPDGRGTAVVCVVPEVMRQLQELGLGR